MQYFRDVEWETHYHDEEYTDTKGQVQQTCYLTITGALFPYEEWVANIGFKPGGPENIYEYCSERLTRSYCKNAVKDAAVKLYVDPGYLKPFEKMASFYILRLLASIDYKKVWELWPKIPTTDDMLKDEIFCLCVVALHPVLFGKLHPIGRNNRRVCLEAIAGWNLPKYSLLQFVHPDALKKFGGISLHPNDIGCQIQSHTDKQYWVFDDHTVMSRAIGKAGKRRWFEMEFAGPNAISFIVKERLKHGNSIDALRPYVDKNKYVTYQLPTN